MFDTEEEAILSLAVAGTVLSCGLYQCFFGNMTIGVFLSIIGVLLFIWGFIR